MTRAALLVHLGSTLAMAGILWFVQVVHYPLFARVGAPEFARYSQAHSELTTWVVGPLMLAELATALWLVARPPASVAPGVWWIGLALLAVIWLATAFVSVPLHGVLAGGFDPRAHRALVLTNLIRTLAWTARAGLVLFATQRLLRA